jgi:hypothetical protein
MLQKWERAIDITLSLWCRGQGSQMPTETAKRISLNTTRLFTFIYQSFFLFWSCIKTTETWGLLVLSWQLEQNRFRPYISSCSTSEENKLFYSWLRVQHHDFQRMKHTFDIAN